MSASPLQRHLYYTTTAGGSWSTQQPMNPGSLGGPPKAVAQPGGAEDVFWRGTDNHLWHTSFVPGHGWVGGQNLGGDLYPMS
jgi:hypothetical protein